MNSFAASLWVIIQNLGNRVAAGNEAQDVRHHYPRTPDDRLTVANTRVNRNPIFYHNLAPILALRPFGGNSYLPAIL